jgi:hypothetical protein
MPGAGTEAGRAWCKRVNTVLAVHSKIDAGTNHFRLRAVTSGRNVPAAQTATEMPKHPPIATRSVVLNMHRKA